MVKFSRWPTACSARTSITVLTGHTDSVLAVAFLSPDGLTVAGGGADDTVRIWKLAR